MVYTIKIDASQEQGLSLVNFIKTLARDYKFLKVEESEEDYILTKEQEKELDRRLKYVIENPKIGKSWDEVEKSLRKKK